MTRKSQNTSRSAGRNAQAGKKRAARRALQSHSMLGGEGAAQLGVNKSGTPELGAIGQGGQQARPDGASSKNTAKKAQSLDQPEGGSGGIAKEQKRRLNDYIKRRQSLLRDRDSWIPVWQQIIDYIAPRAGRIHTGSNTNRDDRSAKIRRKIVDSTPRDALRTMASGLMSGLTSPARPWFKLGLRDEILSEQHEVRAWLEDCTHRMQSAFANSNLYKALPRVYSEIGAFGTAGVFVERDADLIFRFRPFTIGEYAIANGPDGRVDSLFHSRHMTVGALIDEYGLDAVSARVRNLADQGQLDQHIEVNQIIQKNRLKGQTSKSFDKPYESVHWEQGASEKDGFLRISGFDRFPAMVPRWEVNPGDAYGFGPGDVALSDCMQLQDTTRIFGKMAHKDADPPMVAMGQFAQGRRANTAPGGITYVSAYGANGPAFQQAENVRRDYGGILQAIADQKFRINRAFYADLFLMLQQSDRRQITAREIDERSQEKLLMLSPALQQLEHELLKPLVERSFQIMAESGALPPPPTELMGVDLDVDFVSPLAQAQRLVGLGAIERTIGFAMSAAQADPHALDRLDFDRAVKEVALIAGAPAGIVRADDVVAAKVREREAQAQAAQMAQMAQMVAGQAEQVSRAAKTVSETDMKALKGAIDGGI